MKIRNGFVSNSSSSSFVIEQGEKGFNTVYDVAKYMISKVYDQKSKEVIDRLEKYKDTNNGVSFYSCNSDTYIVKHKDLFLVETCNNEEWDLWEFDHSDSNDKELLNKYPELDPNKDGYIYINEFMRNNGSEYFCLERGFKYKKADGWGYCELPGDNYNGICGGSYVNIMDEDTCPKCWSTPEGNPSKYKQFLDREKKLDRVLK